MADENESSDWNEMAEEEPQSQSNPPPPPPNQQPAPAQPYAAPPAKPKKPFFEKITSNKMLSVFVTLGLVLMVVGAIMIHMAPQTTNYGSNEPTQVVNEKQADGDYDDMDDYQDALLDAQHKEQNDAAAGNTMNYLGSTMADIGIFLIVMVLLLAAFLRNDLPESVRFGLFFAVGLILFAIGFRR